jgi:hypothetical protein
MEELKLLIEMVSKLPAMALWVLVGFWAYKVIVIGSIYGVIRLIVEKAHSYLTTPKHELKTVEARATIDGMVITGNLEHLLYQLRRLQGTHAPGTSGPYIHDHGVRFLREALDDKFAKEETKLKKAA